ncbi:MAG TPA: Crp/Fnr family transcriptional regulator [Chitinophagaceae bacterium]|nr:Crp/Fnr family transcriptional regulator [Chitinophagaceae bacterium]
MFDLVKKSIQQFGSFSEKDLMEVVNRLRTMQLRKDAVLIPEGHVCREFYFVNKGCFRQYTITDEGTEATLNLYVEEDWMFDYKSFISQRPTDAVMQAAEDSEVLRLDAHDFHDLVKISDGFFRIGVIFQQAIQNQDYQNNRVTPEEKYSLLLARKPRIVQKFPLKHVASYLGMTPETLSRIRRKIIS